MRQAHVWIVVSAAALFLATACLGQSAPDKKSHMFHGKVEAINSTTIKVNGEKVEGWMEAMTMDYKVDDSAILKELKAGDQIMATVYDGDPVLHKVQVMPKAAGDSKSKK
jgi:Cu/Ag efflux protein CusF